VAVARVRLSYADCDPAGIIYYAAWFVVMERQLSAWFFDAGFRFDTMLAEVGATPVTRSTWCDYLAPARAYDQVRVEMSVAEVGRRSYRLAFEMTRETDGVVVARAGIGCVAVDADGRAVDLPTGYRALLEGA
jgi:YbgC/YbaW family acyl-CoA thioester hydrolase